MHSMQAVGIVRLVGGRIRNCRTVQKPDRRQSQVALWVGSRLLDRALSGADGARAYSRTDADTVLQGTGKSLVPIQSARTMF
jgi:hypothetical protein